MKAPAEKPWVIVVSSHVARGGVGNRAAVFALERLGFTVVAVPTVILPFHPGHGKGTRIVPDPVDFASLLADLAGSLWLGRVGGVLSGYLGEAGQAEAVAELVGAVKAANREALYLCDPVIGDAAGPYMPAATVTAIGEKLLPIADIATPNRFELGSLAGSAAGDEAGLAAAARSLGAGEVAVTSALVSVDRIANLAVTANAVHSAGHERIAHAPHGTGDLFAALYLASRLEGAAAGEALARAGNACLRIVRAAAGHDEMPLAAAQHLLLKDWDAE